MTASTTTSDDPYLSTQWAVDKIDLPLAWDITTGSSSVVVGVLDSGIDASHPDLTNRVNTSLSRIFSHGNIVQPTVVTDANAHGTHVAGIIAARGNNGTGISGVGWNIKVASLQILDSEYHGLSSDVANAIDFATSKGIPILNLSAGWHEPTGTSLGNMGYYDAVLSSAISNYPGLFVCSAGNNTKNNNSFDHYPSNYRLSNLIAVGSSTQSDTCASTSNYGSQTVDIFAPGVSILSCYPVAKCTSGVCNSSTHYANGYHYMSGTSMAAPYVAGVAALMLSKNRSLSAATLKSKILDNSEQTYESNGICDLAVRCISKGKINAYWAVNNLSHTHLYTYISRGGTWHEKTCSCGRKLSENHSYAQSGPTIYCTLCDYEDGYK